MKRENMQKDRQMDEQSDKQVLGPWILRIKVNFKGSFTLIVICCRHISNFVNDIDQGFTGLGN